MCDAVAAPGAPAPSARPIVSRRASLIGIGESVRPRRPRSR